MSGRQVFSESEKTCLQELIIKYKLNTSATIGAGNPAVKKTAWARLTTDFNSIETNTRRMEAQLKKCWDNLKTRRKQALALEKRERMKTGGGRYHPQPSTSNDTIDDALLETTDVELQFAIDCDDADSEILEESMVVVTEEEPILEVEAAVQAVEETSAGQPATVQVGRSSLSSQSADGRQADSQRGDAGRARTTARGSGSRLSDYDAASSQASGAKNVRSHVITEEFLLRQRNYKRAEEREEELHRLKVAEKEWLVKLPKSSTRRPAWKGRVRRNCFSIKNMFY